MRSKPFSRTHSPTSSVVRVLYGRCSSRVVLHLPNALSIHITISIPVVNLLASGTYPRTHHQTSGARITQRRQAKAPGRNVARNVHKFIKKDSKGELKSLLNIFFTLPKPVLEYICPWGPSARSGCKLVDTVNDSQPPSRDANLSIPGNLPRLGRQILTSDTLVPRAAEPHRKRGQPMERATRCYGKSCCYANHTSCCVWLYI